MLTATPSFQISLRFSLPTPVLELQANLRQVLESPWTLKDQRYQYKVSVHWHTSRFSKLPYLGMKFAHWSQFQKLHIYSLSTPGDRHWAYFLSTGSGFRNTGRLSKVPCILARNLATGKKIQELHIRSISTPGGQNWVYFCSTGSCFRDTGRFSKLPYSCMKLCHCPKFQKLHIYYLSTPRGSNWVHFRSIDTIFRDTVRFSKLPYLGMKLGH